MQRSSKGALGSTVIRIELRNGYSVSARTRTLSPARVTVASDGAYAAPASPSSADMFRNEGFLSTSLGSCGQASDGGTGCSC